MTRIALAIAAFAAAVCFGMPSSQAGQTGNAPWCAVQNLGMGDVEWDCQYASAAACAPNVTGGNRGFCVTSIPISPRKEVTRPRRATGITTSTIGNSRAGIDMLDTSSGASAAVSR